jgi:ABC-2 type transport system ATP-binding protein
LRLPLGSAKYAPPVIEINELTKYYGERRAVGPLSVSIERGEVVGLLGLNGAGKTTTLRMLSSDLLPTSGTMTVDGIDLVEQPERVRPKIGYLPDRPPLYGEMSVREFLKFAGQLRGMKKGIAKRVDEVIELTDLHDYTDEPINNLSHGFRQRVGIAQAIVHQPALLLLDEPISGLDPVQIVEMRNLIRSLRGEHTTVLSSHILSEISETCDRLLVIRDGEIVASGSEADLSAHITSVHMFEVTVRVHEARYRDDPAAAAQRIAEDIQTVSTATLMPPDEPGDDIAKLRVSSTADVREDLVKALVAADMGVLRIDRGAKELESVFLELTGDEAEEEEDE